MGKNYCFYYLCAIKTRVLFFAQLISSGVNVVVRYSCPIYSCAIPVIIGMYLRTCIYFLFSSTIFCSMAVVEYPSTKGMVITSPPFALTTS